MNEFEDAEILALVEYFGNQTFYTKDNVKCYFKNLSNNQLLNAINSDNPLYSLYARELLKFRQLKEHIYENVRL